MRAKFLSTLRTLIVFWIISTLSNQAFALNTKKLFKSTVDSVVLVMSFDSNNQPLAIGSGFFVDGGKKIVTNYHVISGATSVRIKLTSGNVSTLDTILGVDTDHDLVLLESPIKGSPLKLSSRIPEIGEDIIAIGNPKGLEGTLSTGVVSGIRNDKGSTYYQVTAPISPGSSGGPIINEKGEVLGVSTFYFSGGQNLNFAMPSEYIQKIIKSPKSMGLEIASKEKPERAKRVADDKVKIIKPRLNTGFFSASVLNRSNYPIKNVRYIAIFYSGKYNGTGNAYSRAGNDPLHYVLGIFKGVVPPNLGKRFQKNDDGVSMLWAVEFRVIDYDIIDQPRADGLIPTFD